DLAASAQIIEMTGDRSSLRFYHQLLQEYFAAREMLKRDPVGLVERWRWPWLEKDMPPWARPEGSWDPLPPPPPTNWEGTTIMAAGLMPENDDRLVRALIEINPVLAGRCLHEGQAEVAPEIRQVVVDRLLATISDPEVALRVRIAAGEVLGYLGDPRLGELVTIPAGTFLMGDDKDYAAKPKHEVVLPEFRIGKYPVTNAEFREFIEAGGYDEKRWWTQAGWRRREKENWSEPRYWGGIRVDKPNQPVVGVSWYECLAFCRWLRTVTDEPYRPPTEAEWEKAARGTDGRQYPWGNEFEPQRLNSSEGDQIVNDPTPVGLYPTGVSPYGCQDMAGNVWEWTSTHWGKDWDKPEYSYPYDPSDGRENLEAGDDVCRVLRGGSGFRYVARCAFRELDYPLYWSSNRGFRVVVSTISS
ncbi:MAG: formylglycine-generating enzyme family protein, partial [Desulfobacterales bacterium]